jgi:hypothetical protein
MTKLYTLVGVLFLLAASGLGTGETVNASPTTNLNVLPKIEADNRPVGPVRLVGRGAALDVGEPAQTVTSDKHFMFFGNSFSPEDKYYFKYQVELRNFFDDLSNEVTLNVSDAKIYNSIGNPAQFVSKVLVQVERNLGSLLKSESSGQLSQVERPIEITIYLNGHGGENGTLKYFDTKAMAKQEISFADFWEVVDQQMLQIETRFHVKPKLNLIVETCFFGSMNKALKERVWLSKNTEFNILATSDSHEPSHTTGVHTLLDLAFSISNSLNFCSSCTGMERAMRLVSQLPLTVVSSNDSQMPQMFVVSQGKYSQYQFSSNRYLKLMNKLIEHISLYGEKLKLGKKVFKVDPAALFRRYAPQLLAKAHQLEDQAQRQHQIHGQAKDQEDAIEIVSKLTKALVDGQLIKAINSISEFNHAMRTWSAPRTSTSGQMAQIEMGYLNAWVLGINSGVFKFGPLEERTLRTLSMQDQVWFEQSLKSRSVGVNFERHLDDKMNTQHLSELLQGQSGMFSEKIALRTDLVEVQEVLYTRHWKKWLDSLTLPMEAESSVVPLSSQSKSHTGTEPGVQPGRLTGARDSRKIRLPRACNALFGI